MNNGMSAFGPKRTLSAPFALVLSSGKCCCDALTLGGGDVAACRARTAERPRSAHRRAAGHDLCHQLNIVLRRAPPRLQLRGSDRALMVWLIRLWPNLLSRRDCADYQGHAHRSKDRNLEFAHRIVLLASTPTRCRTQIRSPGVNGCSARYLSRGFQSDVV